VLGRACNGSGDHKFGERAITCVLDFAHFLMLAKYAINAINQIVKRKQSTMSELCSIRLNAPQPHKQQKLITHSVSAPRKIKIK
jgi:hypothetical protein